MDLKDCIIVVNEFAVKNESSSDSRVRSYIMEYMTDGSVAFDVAFDNNKVFLDRDDLNKNANEIQNFLIMVLLFPQWLFLLMIVT